ncbi:hypothetical protein FHR81_001197 [Actinoalloteichus hoggarensis]|uniref:Uncharacterized protein n=1 Tax=Actinoalloteichus hoggarensis TaxID=1470176 RepID=A0A221W035_9PSEU|nr:hypothetical protein [Actinoalloteichus hoggarensis]ASO18931.1 hypothetical protein AHOG_06395 [Actinoalloteichus hoggarensis]MBB5920167.1 hypothetical protein [Actinoalloteichus hoggarensis]
MNAQRPIPRLVAIPEPASTAVFFANLPGHGPIFLMDLGSVHVEVPVLTDPAGRVIVADLLRAVAFSASRAVEWLEQTAGLAAGPLIHTDQRPPSGGLTSGYREVRGQWNEDGSPPNPGVLPQGRHAWPEESDHPPSPQDSNERAERGWWS